MRKTLTARESVGCRELALESVTGMNRFLAFAGAVALTLGQPALTLAAPPAAPVYRGASPIYRPSAPARPAPPLHFPAPTLPRSAVTTTIPLAIPNRYVWRNWGWNQGLIVYPLACYGSSGFWGPWGLLSTPTPSLGSTIGDQFGEVYSAPYNVGSVNLAVQPYGLQPALCGSPNLVPF
jgi:hypothetical protein